MRRGVRITPPEARDRVGELNPNAKLSDAQARRLREQRAKGWSVTDLASSFGISETGCLYIIRGVTYKAAGGPIEASGTKVPKGSSLLTGKRAGSILGDGP